MTPQPDEPVVDVRGGHRSKSSDMSVALPAEFVETVAACVAELLAERAEAVPERWVGVAAAAEHLACGRNRIYALVSAGRIPFVKDGSRLLFRPSALDAWLASGGGIRP